MTIDIYCIQLEGNQPAAKKSFTQLPVDIELNPDNFSILLPQTNSINYYRTKLNLVKIFFIMSTFVLLVRSQESPGHAKDAFTSEKIRPHQKFLFYLHGGIVQEQGINAVSAEFGAYKYQNIVDTLRSFGYRVISEVRPKGTVEIVFAEKVAKQIDSLLRMGIPPENIIVVGASQGAYIAIEVSWKLRNPEVRYVIMGLCWEYSLNYFSNYKSKLCGNFLSIYESSDAKGSCDVLLKNKFCKSGYKEIRLAMGNGHGFIFRPFPEWVRPLIEWIETK